MAYTTELLSKQIMLWVEPYPFQNLSEFYPIRTKDITAHKQEAQIQWDITDWDWMNKKVLAVKISGVYL